MRARGSPVFRGLAKPPTFDEKHFRYRGRVAGHPIVCPAYTMPYSFKGRRVHTFKSGEDMGELRGFTSSECSNYVSALSDMGWVNVWCRFNKQGERTNWGVWFVCLQAEPIAQTPRDPTPTAASPRSVNPEPPPAPGSSHSRGPRAPAPSGAAGSATSGAPAAHPGTATAPPAGGQKARSAARREDVTAPRRKARRSRR